jgi:hypothetical protein
MAMDESAADWRLVDRDMFRGMAFAGKAIR